MKREKDFRSSQKLLFCTEAMKAIYYVIFLEYRIVNPAEITVISVFWSVDRYSLSDATKFSKELPLTIHGKSSIA
jgi:hypothetical protein